MVAAELYLARPPAHHSTWNRRGGLPGRSAGGRAAEEPLRAEKSELLYANSMVQLAEPSSTPLRGMRPNCPAKNRPHGGGAGLFSSPFWLLAIACRAPYKHKVLTVSQFRSCYVPDISGSAARTASRHAMGGVSRASWFRALPHRATLTSLQADVSVDDDRYRVRHMPPDGALAILPKSRFEFEDRQPRELAGRAHAMRRRPSEPRSMLRPRVETVLIALAKSRRIGVRHAVVRPCAPRPSRCLPAHLADNPFVQHHDRRPASRRSRRPSGAARRPRADRRSRDRSMPKQNAYRFDRPGGVPGSRSTWPSRRGIRLRVSHRKQLRGKYRSGQGHAGRTVATKAAFVDYGGNRHGFLAFSEIDPDYYQIPVADRQALIAEDERAQRAAEAEADHRAGRRHARRERGSERSRDEVKSEPVESAQAESEVEAMTAASEHMAPSADSIEQLDGGRGGLPVEDAAQPIPIQRREDASDASPTSIALVEALIEPAVLETSSASEPVPTVARNSARTSPATPRRPTSPLRTRTRARRTTSTSADNITEVNGHGAEGEEENRWNGRRRRRDGGSSRRMPRWRCSTRSSHQAPPGDAGAGGQGGCPGCRALPARSSSRSREPRRPKARRTPCG